MPTIQEYLDKHYPKENRSKITEIKIDRHPNSGGAFPGWQNIIEGELDLSDFPNLKKLNITLSCWDYYGKIIQDITIKDLSKNTELEEIYFNGSNGSNHETNINLCSHLTKLKRLILTHSERSKKWCGTLKSLENCKDLQYLDLSNSKVEGGLEYLPSKNFVSSGLPGISIKNDKRFECRNTVFKDILKPYNYDIRAWQIVNHPELLEESKEELVRELTRKEEQAFYLIDNAQEVDAYWRIGRDIVITCEGYLRLRTLLRILRTDLKKKTFELINQLKSEVQKQKENKETQTELTITEQLETKK